MLYTVIDYAGIYDVLRILRQIHLTISLPCHQKQDKQCGHLMR